MSATVVARWLSVADEFYIKEDIKVEMYLPVANTGVWNFSKWDSGDDWMASTGFAWTDVVADVVSATIELGGTVEQGYSAPATPNMMSLTMQSKTYDPFNNVKVHVGTPIRFSYRQNPDTASTTWTVLFNGLIDNFDVSYEYHGLNTINIQATSSLKRALNKVFPVWNPNGYVPGGYVEDAFNYWCSLTGITRSGVVSSVGARYALDYYNDYDSGQALDDLNQFEAGFFYQKADDTLTWTTSSYIRYLLTLSATNSFSNTHSSAATHFCISDIAFTYAADNYWNQFKAICESSTSINKTVTNQDSIDLIGVMAIEKSLHIYPALSELDFWLNNVKVSIPTRQVSSITTPIIRQNATLANVAALLPTSTVGIQVTTSGYTVNDKSIITKATHEITPENWIATVELWKGI